MVVGMGVRREVVVRIDTDVDVVDRARRLTKALVETQVIVERAGREQRYGPGPAAATVLEPGVEWVELDDTGVDISARRSVYHSFGNWARPNCNRCGAPLERGAMQAALDAWFAAAEPVLTCPRCGWTALVGDWPAPWPFAVGAPAVVFQNWPPLDPQFLSEVRAAIGGRSRVVRVLI